MMYGRKNARTAAEVRPPNHWDVIALLMRIDPPPPDGQTWLDGHMDGIYMVQCHLKGKAQGQAMNGDYAAAVETAKTAVELNRMRDFSGLDDDTEDETDASDTEDDGIDQA